VSYLPGLGDIRPRALLSLRIAFGVVVLLLWNAGSLYARFLGAPFTRLGLFMGGLCGLGLGFTALAILKVATFRNFATHPDRRAYYEPGFFRFIAFIGLVLGFGWLVAGLLTRNSG